LVIAAARGWKFPPAYISALEQFLPARSRGAGPRKLEQLPWT
jgi:hypothetical protein